MADDGFDMFGSDDEEEDDVAMDEKTDAGDKHQKEAIALYLSTFFLKKDSQVKLRDRVVGVVNPSGGSLSALQQRGFSLVSLGDAGATGVPLHLDALLLFGTLADQSILNCLLPGGILIGGEESNISTIANDNNRNEYLDSSPIDNCTFTSRIKRSVQPHTSTCPWLPSSFSHQKEREYLQQATVTLSAQEIQQSQMTETSKKQAVASLAEHGYVVIRNLLDPAECQKWGNAVLESVHMAAEKLLVEDKVDILNPQNSENEPQSYRELSMREDLRLDLRDGPPLAKLRQETGDTGTPLVISVKTEQEQTNLQDRFLRGHKCLLEVIRRTMNPKKGNLYQGNLGRYNFSGSGPDGSFQDIRVSQVGGIVSFPGAAEQAIHADCSHLFETMDCHPAHYINIFTPGVPFDDKVGGTAFCQGSHRLEFTAKHCGSSSSSTREADDDGDDDGGGGGFQTVYPYLARPSLTLGDVVLFDCRILHFGMANASDSVERVLLYSNTTQAWFHDPKNWEDQRPIF